MKKKYVHQANDSIDISPAELVPFFCSMLNPKSVVDIGCGPGHWLIEFSKNGVGDITGIDGSHLDKSLYLPALETLILTDLENPFSLNRTFDLAICFEVAEHLSENSADQFIESLTKLSDNILFSAAIPGQGGQNHINEQWPSYWQSKFKPTGFRFFDIIRPKIWWNQKIKPHYRQNIFLVSKNSYSDTSHLPVIDAVHPDMLIQKANKYLTGAYGLNKTLKKWKKSKAL
jgi:SAM-dependent methyltransferase